MALNYVGRIPIDNLCDAFEDPDHQLNDWLDEHGIDYNAEVLSCAAISIGAVKADPRLGAIVAGVCAGPTLGCAVNDAIRENTPCDAQYVGVYVTDARFADVKYPVGLKVMCESIDVPEEAEEAAKEMANDLEDAANDGADYAVEVGQDVIKEIEK
ncbi:hypothetical protein [Haloferax elongans]|uniref:hypothetical protein n=1 Tax=Haloferax elongans TaxID=403191 RepID=UPI0012675819|nr:hypothetical protein [Haloferax elongans]